jgi:DegV family protein with EDD domain
MEKIGLLIDSTSLTREDIRPYPFVKVASLNVTIDGVDREELSITTEEIVHALRNSKSRTTSQPAPGAYLKLYEEFVAEGYTHVLVVTLSSKISGTFQSAEIAKGMMEGPLEIVIHGSKVASFGVALSLSVIVKEIDKGATFDKVVAHLKKLDSNGAVLFTLNDLMHLFRGGRLNRVQALLGSVLRVKPIIEMVEGKLEMTKKERTNIACFDYFMETIKTYQEKFKTVYVDIVSLNRPEWGVKLKDAINEQYPKVNVHQTDYVSPVFFVHLGDQGFGVAIIAE